MTRKEIESKITKEMLIGWMLVNGWKDVGRLYNVERGRIFSNAVCTGDIMDCVVPLNGHFDAGYKLENIARQHGIWAKDLALELIKDVK